MIYYMISVYDEDKDHFPENNYTRPSMRVRENGDVLEFIDAQDNIMFVRPKDGSGGWGNE